ncbi:MAG: LCP family protein [Caldanaerobacter subterraneus]|nr:LCP family protein [Caldanaerobacter subterraneus]
MKRFFKIFALFLGLLILSLGTGAYIYLKSLNPSDASLMNLPTKEDKKNPEEIKVLILGIDETSPDDPHRSDTMMVISYNLNTQKGYILSIPRDTMVTIPGHGVQKINAAYPIGGPKLAMEEVSQLTGEDISYYVKIDYEGFKKLVDAIGGVEMNVPMDMNYDDYAGNLHIHLKKGWQHLDGEEALQLVRFRHGYAEQDLERVKVQREFLLAALDKIKSPSILLKLPQLLKTVNQYVETNIPPSLMVKYAEYAAKVSKNDIITATLPGNPEYINSIAYYVVDPEEIKKFMSDLQKGELNQSVKVEVLNGCGIPGAAGKVAEILKQQGFDVVRVGNVNGASYDTTQIILRSENKKAANELKKLLKNAVIVEDYQKKSDADITIILGKNVSLEG